MIDSTINNPLLDMFSTSDDLDRLLMPPPSRTYATRSNDVRIQAQQGVELPLPSLHDQINKEADVYDTLSPGRSVSPTSSASDDNDEVEEINDESGIHVYPDYKRSDNLSRRKRTVPPEAMSNCKFKDIIGHGAVKLRIEEIMLTMNVPPNLASTVLTGVRAMPSSILLYGPPGCGKTQLARSIAGEGNAAFISISPSDILSKFIGESESAIREVFCTAESYAHQVESKCAVVFFDEIDALGQSRDDMAASEGGGCSRRVLAELLTQLSNLSDHQRHIDRQRYSNFYNETDTQQSQQVRILIVAATNRPEDCDTALLRRFGIRLKVDLPSKRDRRKMFKQHLKPIEHSLTTAELDDLASSTDGYSGSDIENLTREAVMAPVRECIRDAAVSKRRARVLQADYVNDNGDDDNCIETKLRRVDPDAFAQSVLLDGLKVLRRVTIDDFDNAFQVWLGQVDALSGEDDAAEGTARKKQKQVHFDSSSSEGENDADESKN